MTRWEYMTVAETHDWQDAKSEFDINYWILTPEKKEAQKVEEAGLTSLFNRLGGEGWELVSQLARQNGILLNTRGLHTGGVAVEIWHTFKRPKPS